MDKKERSFAKHFAKTQCGVLHAEWAMDAFWGEVTRDIILPGCLAIHEALVKKNATEKEVVDFHDDTVFFIPQKTKDRKVFVHTTQSQDFLYVLNKGFSLKEDENSWDLHIRRIYRDMSDDTYTIDELKKGGIKAALQYADWLTQYHDDHYQYSHRPSLEAYRKVNFQIPYHPKDRDKEHDYYGDFRDGGYILSYEGWMASSSGPRVEGSIISHHDMKHIATLYLSHIAEVLEIKVPQMKGYAR